MGFGRQLVISDGGVALRAVADERKSPASRVGWDVVNGRVVGIPPLDGRDPAVVAGELQKNVDVPRLARLIEAIIGGSLMSWACYREGSAAAWIRQDVDAVLEPHLALRRGSKRSKSGRGAISRRSTTR